ncbi:hypothetical protein GCM10012275_58520 [Longimycelium tulufanense]|uniref:DUF4232 domain-containing protein n=1 Tax=Longimycelium tulufanense TaxID=907463 RepID=A0A8J3CE32_9PSEU|nr:DUF4232 domain-containing protein [Longimycelium tulufanense]GGM80222.1 hypothetical protein GCM10012275_58520 [Longimycelium tulufanense]
MRTMAGAILVAGVVFTACGGPTGGPAQPTGNDNTATSPRTTAHPVSLSKPENEGVRCTAEMLQGRIELQDQGAGQRYGQLVVTNVSDRACQLYGYAGLELVSSARGERLPTNVERVDEPGPSLVRLAPGERAAMSLHWGVVPGSGEPYDRPCQPEADVLSVIPPDETEPFRVPWSFGVVCQQGRIEAGAFHGL